jgi:hypothetical protein
MKPTMIVALILALLSVFPLLRILFQWDITMNGSPVPMWMSFAAFLLFAALAGTLWRE